MSSSLNPQTIALHAGYRSDPETHNVRVPLHHTTAYIYDDANHAADLFALKKFGNIYTRLGNPTTEVLEKRMAALEGGAAGLATASGQAASTFCVLNLARAGDNIVSSTDLYGGTYNLFKNTLRDQGIETRFVDPADPESFRKATDDRTRAYYAETLPNPKLNVFPIAEVAEIGRRFGIPLIKDNTAAPLICRPFDHGAAIVMYSTTKWINGHGNAIGGMIIDSGKFDWAQIPGRQPALNEPDPSYHGEIWTKMEAVKKLGNIAYILKARLTLLRDYGSCQSPSNAHLTLLGMETLALRMKAHCENAALVAAYLNSHPEVSRVIHPSLATGYDKTRAKKYLKNGYGGLLGFEMKRGAEAGKAFINALKMVYHVSNIGDTRTLATHPASTTHAQLSPEEQRASGVTPGYVRLSIGIEHPDDIIADLDQAIAAAVRK